MPSADTRLYPAPDNEQLLLTLGGYKHCRKASFVNDSAPPSATRIDRAAFGQRFGESAEVAVSFAPTMVRQALAGSRRFLIEPSASSDGNPVAWSSERTSRRS